MERMKGMMLVCLFLVCSWLAVSHGAVIQVQAPGSTDVGEWSDYAFVTASEAPNTTITITLTNEASTDDGGAVALSKETIELSPTVQSASFRVRYNKAGLVLVKFEITGDTGSIFFPINSVYFTFQLRTISFDNWPASVFVGQPSEPIKLYLVTPSSADLTFTAEADDDSIKFSSPIVIPAGQLSTSFTYIATDIISFTYVTWTVSGQEVDWYSNASLSNYYSFPIRKRFVTTPRFSGTVLLSSKSTVMQVYTRQSVNNSLTVTPQVADTVFTPATFEFTPNTRVATFTFNSSSPFNAKSVNFYLGGADQDWYQFDTPASTINVPRRTITVTAPSTFVLTNTTYLSISLSAPAVSSVTVALFAANVQFNTSSVTFEGNQTTHAVAIKPTNLGPDTISFLISGNDAEYYNEIEDIDIAVGGGSFIGPANWYIPPLWVGVESDRIPIRASWSPITEVNVTLSAPDVVFNPPTLRFRNGTEQQYFTITPQYVDNDGSAGYPSITVTFLLSGPDHTFFSVPAPFQVQVIRRNVQIVWSPHLYDNTRHLRKDYKVWATANYVTKSDQFSVTPVSPYFSFKPAVLNFDSKTTRIEFTATVTGVVGTATIDYIIGGRDGGWYDPIQPNTVTTSIRPLYLSSAVLAPDTRVKGHWFYAPTQTELVQNHVYSFVINSSVLPTSSLTITPRSNHVQFSPRSITVKASDAEVVIDRWWTKIRNDEFNLPGLFLEANFSAKGLSAGIHEVWFELSGKDADYYDRPDHVWLNFKTVTRADEEPKQEAGGAMVVPSITLMAAVSALAAILLM